MTRQTDKLTLVRKLVVVFDICSSTSILEDLKQTDNLAQWRNLLINVKEFLAEKSGQLNLEVYKFTGDGWILLLPTDTTQNDLMEFMRDVAVAFDCEFDCCISGLLQRQPACVGVAFGVDSGELVRVEMNEQIEYLGRAINVASRLQDATKELRGGPSNKALLSNPSFNSLPQPGPPRPAARVTVALRNIIEGSNYECLEYQVL
jgi:class 3 adenylate cyclase